MLKTLLLIIVLTLVFPAQLSAAPASIEGFWITKKKDAVIRIEPCGDQICGFVDWISNNARQTSADGRPLCQAKVLYAFKPDKAGSWKNGKIFQAAEGKEYDALMSIKSPNTLEIRGYVGLPLVGKTKTLTRVSPTDFRRCDT